MAQKKKSLNIPIQVRQARNSIYLSLVIGFVPPILYEAITNQTKPLDPESLLIEMIAEMIAIVLVGFLAYMLGQGKNWARITLSVFFIAPMIKIISTIHYAVNKKMFFMKNILPTRACSIEYLCSQFVSCGITSSLE